MATYFLGDEVTLTEDCIEAELNGIELRYDDLGETDEDSLDRFVQLMLLLALSPYEVESYIVGYGDQSDTYKVLLKAGQWWHLDTYNKDELERK